MNEKIDLKSLTLEELTSFIGQIGEKKFRAKQIFCWIYRGVRSIDEMTDISKALREKLKESCFIESIEIEKKLVSKLDGTMKYLFRLSDGNLIESVFMRYKHGNTVCVSSQVGCRMGCRFCASTLGGLVRNLTAGEIIDQVMRVQEDAGEPVSNIVMMGIGEPFDNYENVLRFLKNVNHPDGLHIGYRHISVSTCGLVDRIYDFAREGLPVTLSISLHAPFDELRSEIMPVNRKFSLKELIPALQDYLAATSRRISIEYTMIRGKNDTKQCADELIRLFGGMLCHVNLIPVNNVAERSFQKSDSAAIRQFMEYLTKHGLNATVRRELGSDINAACGQLRKSTIEQEENRSDRGD